MYHLQATRGRYSVPTKQSASSAAGPLTASDVELLHESLREAEKRAALLTELIEAMNQSRDALTLLQRSVEAVVRAVAASGAFVYLWDSDAGRYVMRAATEGHQRAFVGLISLRPGEGLTGWSALMRRPVLIGENLDQDPRLVVFPELQEDEFQSCLIVPILVPGGDTVGVFSIYSVEEHAFADSDLHMVDEVAKLLASGIDRAHVVDLWERQSAVLDSLVGAAESAPGDVHGCLSDLANKLMGILPSEICVVESVVELDGSPSEAVALAVRRDVDGRSGGPAAVVTLPLATAKELAKRADPPLHTVSIPMRLADRTLGVISLYRSAPYYDQDRSLLAAVCAYGALALQGLTGREGGDSALARLIAAASADEASSLLTHFGWVPGKAAMAVVARCDPELTLTSSRSLESVAHTVETVFSGRRRRTVTATLGIVAAIVLVDAEDDPVHLAEQLRGEVADALRDKGQRAGVALGVGRPSSSPLSIAGEFHGAVDAAEWATLTADGVRVAMAGDSDLSRRLLALGRDIAPVVADQVARLRTVKEYDDRNGSELLLTMETFVRERGSIKQSSELLYLHRNTLRQRLNKISSLIDQPIESLDDWLPVSLAIQLLRAEGRP